MNAIQLCKMLIGLDKYISVFHLTTSLYIFSFINVSFIYSQHKSNPTHNTDLKGEEI